MKVECLLEAPKVSQPPQNEHIYCYPLGFLTWGFQFPEIEVLFIFKYLLFTSQFFIFYCFYFFYIQLLILGNFLVWQTFTPCYHLYFPPLSHLPCVFPFVQSRPVCPCFSVVVIHFLFCLLFLYHNSFNCMTVLTCVPLPSCVLYPDYLVCVCKQACSSPQFVFQCLFEVYSWH